MSTRMIPIMNAMIAATPSIQRSADPGALGDLPQHARNAEAWMCMAVGIMAKRQEFPLSIRRAALERAGGFCERRSSEGCTVKLTKGKYRFDHVLPDGLGGKPTLANCEVACLACDAPKTYERDIPMMAKADRLRKKAAGIEPKHKRRSRLRAANQEWKRKVDRSVEKR